MQYLSDLEFASLVNNLCILAIGILMFFSLNFRVSPSTKFSKTKVMTSKIAFTVNKQYTLVFQGTDVSPGKAGQKSVTDQHTHNGKVILYVSAGIWMSRSLMCTHTNPHD